MKQDLLGRTGPDYALCRYGLSRTTFRGPQRPLDGSYVAFLGGTETFGKFHDRPFPALVEDRLGVTCVNFGAVNAGVDVFARDATVLAACHDAAATVIQVPGVQNLGNRFYAVHPRRNDRFLRPTAALETLYPDVDFTDVAFTRHLLSSLERTCPQRFAVVRAELMDHWTLRMRSLLRRVGGVKLLLWFAGHLPPLDSAEQDVMMTDPLFVTRAMVEGLRDEVDDTIVIVPPEEGRGGGLRFHPLDQAAAEQMLGAEAHHLAAEALGTVLSPYLSGRS